MNAAPIEVVTSLATVMREENELLSQGRRSELQELAEAKIRLTAELERQVANLTRERADWQSTLEERERAAFSSAVAELQLVSASNAQLLRRQIDLSRELMDAIAAEAKRLVGTKSEVYGATGGLRRTDLPAPISVNTNL